MLTIDRASGVRSTLLEMSSTQAFPTAGALAGRVAVVTGAGRGIGQRVAVQLAQHQIDVALVSRTKRELEETAHEVRDAGSRALVVARDISDINVVDAIKQTVVEQLGSPSILVNAAGVFGPVDLVWKTDPSKWIATQMVNLNSVYLMCHAFVGEMVAQGWGRVINVTSAASLHEPGPANSAYGTSKAALNQFTRHLAAEVAGTGVTANVIHPGDVKTEMWSAIREATERMGPEADGYRDWVQWVEETGGDDPAKASELVLALLAEKSSAVNGRFLWIRDGLQDPVPSWGEFIPDEVWR